KNRSEDVIYDVKFPDHPLSRVRKWLQHFQATLHLSKELSEEAPFFSEKLKKEAASSPGGQIVSLIDEVLALPVALSTISELKTYRLQDQSGTLEDDDRNYVIALCKRLMRVHSGL